ncbi:hypothetical protein D1Q00_gp132 [Trichoplusia ni granulovirus LBIV-12]|uniref:Uncharacterized protein n=2 Tax=Betabaculovirus TaxID=558017 RepID=A0A1D8QLF6_GVTN|nr:hypothetical protein PsunGV_gp142 [Pseudalatia unipuncta granulovirus]YP_009506202.1 hypothetical protein D1Q00_gp132 [Trichoplusia ni granulovirus LBIV-12]ACH69492.1 unknown [Pseudalatia unipuncta granulovirus]AOW41470.1 hypothetical protein [Trichoplusia ni granulovirus LBIV-12]
MDKLFKIKQKRKHIINILNVMVAGVKAGLSKEKVCTRLRYEYQCINSKRHHNSLQLVLELFDYAVTFTNVSFDWKRHVFIDSFRDNITLMIYGGLMEDDFKNFSLWVKSSFYSDANLLYKLCEKCVKKLCLTSKFTYYNVKQYVKSDELYWFVCANICDCCFEKKLYSPIV